MNVIIQIQGRAAVPVRAIPLMSYWTVMAGAELVGIFLKNGKVGEVQRLTAYQLVGGVVSPISANYWADAEIALESLSETMKAKKYSYREWQLRVLQELPDVGFVWLDELEPYFAQLCDADNDSAAEYFQTLGPEKNLVPAMLGLDYTPLTSTELELVVMQGFALAAPRALPTAPNSTEAGGTAPAQNPATPAPVAVGASVAVPRLRAQESRILELLRAQGYDPSKLSQRKPGKPGPKAEIRTLALTGPALFTNSSFDKAWERLRNDGAVAGAE